MSDVFADAVGRWPEIHRALGVPATLLTGKQGPCPKCEGRTRFRFTDHEDRGGFFCNQCGHGDGFDLLRIVRGWDIRRAAEEVRRHLSGAPAPSQKSTPAPRGDRRERGAIWTSAKPLGDVLAARRWWTSRVGFVPSCPDLRASDRLHYGPTATAYPGMVARVVSPCGSRAVQLHRTYLTDLGEKAPVERARMLMPKVEDGEMDGGAVRLASHSGGALGIAEGIETAVAATALTGVPCWAALTATGMTKWEPPAGVVVTIFADNDSHKRFTGLKAAADLAHRLSGQGVTVADVLIPPRKGEDWNDVLIRERRLAA